MADITSTPIVIDQTTILSLFGTVALLVAAYGLSLQFLSPVTPSRLRVLFIWHCFDALIHFFFEGSFLFNCFFSWIPFSSADHHPSTITNFLSRPDRIYGNQHADNPAGALWRVYAMADKRWAGVDLTVVSLELLTVLVAGPMAVWCAVLIARRNPQVGFWMTVLATGELYGGFMTFAPEWLTGSQNLDTSNFMYLWVYLVFFNMLWVVMPLYAIYVSYQDMASAFSIRNKYMTAVLLEQERRKTS